MIRGGVRLVSYEGGYRARGLRFTARDLCPCDRPLPARMHFGFWVCATCGGFIIVPPTHPRWKNVR